ncbi:esterase/lipase family protein [Clavibacter tessellarius]|uniref:esterase/lipase family protein n=1 Tax=Clavibacter tessellarius TaxID=31965 RepID=UPI003244D510
MLPGVYERWQFMLPIIRRLHARGHGVHVVGALGANVGRVAEMARRARAHLEAADLRDVVVVAHSKGGLIGKHLMAFDDPDRRIRSMVAINAPFGGSSYARFIPIRSIRDFSPRNGARSWRSAGRGRRTRGSRASTCASTRTSPAGARSRAP